MEDPSLPSKDFRYTRVNHSNKTAHQRSIFNDEDDEAANSSSSSSNSASAEGAQISTTSLLVDYLSSTLAAQLFDTNDTDNARGNCSDLSGVASGALGMVWDACDAQNPQFNCSVLEYLEYYQGPQTMPFPKAIMVSVTRFGGVFLHSWQLPARQLIRLRVAPVSTVIRQFNSCCWPCAYRIMSFGLKLAMQPIRK